MKYGQPVGPTRSVNILVFGPWSCGKTEFARALTYALSACEEFVVVYMNLPKNYVKEEFYSTTNPQIVRVVEGFIESLLGDRWRIVTCVYSLIKYLSKKVNIRNKRVLSILDEVVDLLRRLNLTARDLVAGLSKEIHDIAWRSRCQVHTILITSERITLYEFKREGG